MSDGLRRELGLRDLVLFNTAAVVGIRWLAAAAHVGPGSLALWISAAALFFVPIAVVVSRLARLCPEEGGLYVWTRREFGEWHGFFCAWCYWLNNFFYLPTLALAGVTIAFRSAGIAREDDRAVVTACALILLWTAAAANIRGLGVGKWLGNLGGASTYLAGSFLIAAGAAAWWLRGAATPLDLAPRLDWEKLNFWPQIAFAFGGLELGAVLGGEIRNPERNVPRAAWWSGLAIALFYSGGTLGLLLLLPAGQIDIMSGLAQAGQAAALLGPGLGWVPAALGVLITAGIIGQLNTWTGGVARLPMVLGAGHYLPQRFARIHPRWGSPVAALGWQAAACTVFLLAMLAGETLRAGYQLLVDMMVITYFIPFLYLFGAGWRAGLRGAAASGAAVTLMALALSFIPPGGTAPVWAFEAKLIAGTAAVLLAARWWFRRAAGRLPVRPDFSLG